MIPPRIEEKIAYEPMSGCWIWTGAVGKDGYGRVWFDRRVMLAHRVLWWLVVGPPPEDTLDHWCKTLRCVNPAHARVMPGALNSSLTSWRSRTHCPYDHEYTPENTVTRSKGRECKICRTRRRMSAPSAQPAARRARYAKNRARKKD